MSRLNLYNHNKKAYEKIKKTFETENVVGIVHATGTGKSYLGLELSLDNKDKKIIYVVPSNSINEHINEIIENNNIDSKELEHIEFRTYQSFVNMSQNELSELNVDMLILDEFHHIGAPVWGTRINKIIETHENIKVFGMSAYTIRDRGTINERDLVASNANELFSNKIVSRYDLCDAMIDGVLPKPIYKSAYIKLESTLEKIEEKLETKNKNSKDYIDCKKILDNIKKKIHKVREVSELFKTNIKDNGKYIYFCPPNSLENENDIDTIINEVKKWLFEMGLNENDFIIYKTTSKMQQEGKKNRDAFYNDKDLFGNISNNKLRIMFAINQYNEGIHAPNLDGVIMGRGTASDIVYFEQLGRALTVGKNNESEPLILDLTNNYDFIKELESNLKERIKEIQTRDFNGRKDIKLEDYSFDIEMLNHDLFEILRYVIDRITITWEDRYELVKLYYEHYKHSNIPSDFKTINGIDYDENGINIGHWMRNQRISFHNGRLSQDKINLLENVEFDFTEVEHDKWNKMYDLARKYYEHHKNLKIPSRFKTINGYEKNESGLDLGRWIRLQMYNYRKGILTDNRIKLLEKIEMNFESNYAEKEWNKMYELAKKYYEHYKDLEIPSSFKTTNGINRDENGINLGMWIFNVRKRYDKLSIEQKKKLDNLNIRLDTFDYEEDWNKKYELAKKYFEHHKNLLIPTLFKTKNGYERAHDGVSLGRWLMGQKNKFNKLSKEKQEKLLSIGFVLNVHEEEWLTNYKLACIYYKHHDNLFIKRNFKTNDGINYAEDGKALGTWIVTQRQNFNNISKERKELLLKIGFVSSVKSNKDKIEELCKMNNINIQKNKTILTKISYQELLSKINYLKEHNLEITINDNLHEIFTMSSPNMKVIYGVTLEELIEKYYIKNKEKGV